MSDLRLFIEARVTIEDRGFSSPCWIWGNATFATGYGRHFPKDGEVHAHRTAHKAFKGPIPEGLDVDHLCRVRSCCNPDHLEAVTRSENMLRAFKAVPAKKRTYCKRGHDLSEVGRHGGECRPCKLERNRIWKQNRRAA